MQIRGYSLRAAQLMQLCIFVVHVSELSSVQITLLATKMQMTGLDMLGRVDYMV